jgi:predicted transcriptional regulator
MCRIKKAQLEHDVLTYMVEHKEAQDTLEGIVEWWLMEQEIQHQLADIQNLLNELVDKDFVIRHKGSDSRFHYRVNGNRETEIRALLAQSDVQNPTPPE